MISLEELVTFFDSVAETEYVQNCYNPQIACVKAQDALTQWLKQNAVSETAARKLHSRTRGIGYKFHYIREALIKHLEC